MRGRRKTLYAHASWREKWMHRIFGFWGKSHWGMLLRSLRHMGKSAPVAFPPELMGQGVDLLLTGLANSIAFQLHMNWILPYWAEKQLRPHSSAFIPSGVNVLTMNLCARNWTSLGVPGYSGEAMVDPVGMLCPGPFEASLFPYLRVDGELWVPPKIQGVEQQLDAKAQGTVHTHFPAPRGLQWESSCFCVEYKGRVWVAMEQRLFNAGEEVQNVEIGFAIRPYHMLAFAPIFRLNFKDQFCRVNQKAFAFFPQSPDHWYVAGRRDLDPLMQAEWEGLKFKCPSGWIVAQAEWDVKLKPGHIWSRWCLMPVHQSKDKNKVKYYPTEGLLEFVEMVQDQHSELQGARMKLPHASLQHKLSLLRHRWHVFDDQTHFSPGTFLYHNHWIRDGAFMVSAFESYGLMDLVRPKIEFWLSQQRRDGEFRSHAGEWDSTGQVIVTVLGHLRKQRQENLSIDWALPKIQLGIRWILKTRSLKGKGAVLGLLPAGFSAEHFGPNDQYYWDNFWSLAALEAWVSWLKDFGEKTEHEIYQRELLAYAEDLSHALAMGLDLDGHLASAPNRSPDASSIGNLIASQPLNLQSIPMQWLQSSCEYLWNNHCRDGLFYQPISHTGKNVYLTVSLARAMQSLGDMRWLDLAESIWQHASPTLSWPEAIHPKTGGGCMGDGDHGWAMAEVLELYRAAWIREQDQDLLLLPSIPLQWWECEGFEFIDFVTQTGVLSLKVQKIQNHWQLQWSIEPGPWSLRSEIKLVLPKEIRVVGRELGLDLWSHSHQIEIGLSGKLQLERA